MSAVMTPVRARADERGTRRLLLTAVAGLLAAVPFCLLGLLVAQRWSPLVHLDARVESALHPLALHSAAYLAVLRALSTVFAPTTFQVLATLAALALLVRRRPRLAAWLAVTVWGGGLLDTLVKQVVGRARPHLAQPVAHAASSSFPSGHALGSLVGVAALLLVGLPQVGLRLRPVLIGLGGVVVVAVGYSRVGLGVHYVSDVLGGWVLGAAWLAATTAAFRTWQADRGTPRGDLSDGLEPAGPERGSR